MAGRELWLKALAIAPVLLALAAAGCTSWGTPTVGGRPLVYKQGPGDAPETVEGKAGAVHKQPAAAPAAQPAPQPRATASSATPAPAPSSPAPTVAQAAPTPRAATQDAAAGKAERAPEDVFNRYTQATRYGDLVFVSGQIAIDARGDFDAKQNVEAQTRRAMENVRAILEANRLTMANVVSATVYLSNISHLSLVDGVYHDFFKATPPARTVVEVSHLPRGALVEISVIAGR